MKISSVCPYCGVGCGIELVIEDKKVVEVLPKKDHPVSLGKLCVKGATLDKAINSPDRLTHPLARKGERFERISWDAALATIAKRLNGIRQTYGNNAIGIFASTKCTNEENYLAQKFARVVIGTNNVDNSTRLCHAPTVYGLYGVFGSSAMTNSYEDLEQADCILIFGNNPAVSQPVAFERFLNCRKHGGKIAVIDVRKTKTAEKADLFIRINPNTDAALIAGMIKTIIREKLEDKKFIKKRTKGYDEFLKSLEKFDLRDVSRITGVKLESIQRIAVDYAKSDKAAIVLGMGITQHVNGMETVQALADLALITGNFGRPGTGINPLRGCNNVQGACDMGCLPNVYPGYASLTAENIKRFESLWRAKRLPVSKGLSLMEMIEGIPERILGLYVIGQNPLLSFPDTNRVRKNLENLQFLVVQDIFLTEAAQLADIVLPAACFAEKTGTITNSERRIQLVRKAVEPPGQAMEDWMIIKLLAKKMDHNFRYNSTEEVFDEIRKCVPTYSYVSYKKLSKAGLQWPCDKKHPMGKRILYDKDFGPKGNRAVFYPVSYIAPEALDHAYPLVLITHRILEHYNAGSMTRRVKALNKAKPQAFMSISKVDAKKLKIKDGERVKVISPFGEVKIKARISDRVSKGVVSMPNHYAEANANKLIPSILDPISKIPAYKYCNVKIEKIR